MTIELKKGSSKHEKQILKSQKMHMLKLRSAPVDDTI